MKNTLLTKGVQGTKDHSRKDWTDHEKRVNSFIPQAATMANIKATESGLDDGHDLDSLISSAFLDAMDFILHKKGLRVLAPGRPEKLKQMFS